ncbi:MAG TPA: zinc-dependent metalloprotease [Solirubrobacteraceae bacterium]|nr:zinc-dependent metalloprotease [Solirubrobacteraceae bacterium]
MIDWRLADTVARAVASTVPAPTGPVAPLAEEVQTFAARSAELVSGYTGLAGADVVPAPETVDRGSWATTNLASMRSILDPLAARAGEGFGPLAGPARVVTGALLAVEVGALSGFLAARVLGQYEFPVLDPKAPARLLFVGPNLLAAAKSLEADDRALTRWVALHETTHALQFAGVPWLREHLAARVGSLVSSMDVAVDPRRLLQMPSGSDLRGLVDAVRRGELISFVAGPERAAMIDELQATMAVLEGYAEHVMDAVGASLLPDLDHLRVGLERRRRERSGLLRLLEKLIGLELKLRQYEQGKRFCDAVVAEGGIAALNRVWAGPERLPSMAELDDPSGWLARAA